MAAQVNSVLKNKKSKVTRKGKAATKKPKDDSIKVSLVEYGYSIPYTGMLHYSLGLKPESDMTPEEKVEYWKNKYENSDKQCSKLEARVGVLERIISGALNRSCNGHE